jgi:hypothetical protein
MKRVRESVSSTQVPWPDRLRTSWDATGLPRDMWRLIVEGYMGPDTTARLALSRVNVALYAAYGGLDKLFDHVFKTGDQERVRTARRVAAAVETFFHPLRLAVLTEGGFDDSRSLVDRVYGELETAELRLLQLFAGTDPELPTNPVLAGGLARALFLRACRKAGLPVAPALLDTYGDSDIWLMRSQHARNGWSDYWPLTRRLFQDALVDDGEGTLKEVLRTVPAGNEWSDRPIQLILPHHGTNEDMEEFVRVLLTTFDFTACQVALTGRWWMPGEGALTMTPLFVYSALSGHMTQGRERPRAVPFPFTQLKPTEHSFSWVGPSPKKVDPVEKARLLRRFFKYLALGYTYPELSVYQLAWQRRIFEGPDVQRALTPVTKIPDSADYPFDIKHVFTLN